MDAPPSNVHAFQNTSDLDTTWEVLQTLYKHRKPGGIPSPGIVSMPPLNPGIIMLGYIDVDNAIAYSYIRNMGPLNR